MNLQSYQDCLSSCHIVTCACRVGQPRSEVLHRDLKPSNIFLSGRSAGSAHYIHEEDSTPLQSGLGA